MTTKEKTFLTIILAQALAFVFYTRGVEIENCSQPAERSASYIDLHGQDTTLEYLRDRYNNFNDAYFDNKLPVEVKIDMNETDSRYMGSTSCTSNNINCTIHFNPHFVASPRYADLTLLHEMCHMPTYDEIVVDSDGQAARHGPRWRVCMLKLDVAGANRYILIDGYRGRNQESVKDGF